MSIKILNLNYGIYGRLLDITFEIFYVENLRLQVKFMRVLGLYACLVSKSRTEQNTIEN